MRLPVFLAACTTAVAVAGCNSSRQTGPVIDPPGPSRPEASAAGPSLPQGAACTGAISRYRSVMENDLSMGHVNQSVYAQVQGEISDAAAACAAGEDAKAAALLRASKARHGYPAG